MTLYSRATILVAFLAACSVGRGQSAAELFKSTYSNDPDSSAYQSLITALKKSRDESAETYILLSRGMLLSDALKRTEAEVPLAEAYSRLKRANDLFGTMIAARYLSGNRVAAKDYAAGKEAALECFRLSRSFNHPEVLGNCLIQYALILRSENKYDSAFFFLRQARFIFLPEDLICDRAIAVMNLGSTHHYLQQFDSSMHYYYESARLFERCEDWSHLVKVYNNLGVIANQMGDHKTARELCQKSIALRQRIGDENGLSYNYAALGNIYLSLEQYDSARYVFGLGLDIHRKLDDKVGMVQALNNLGNTAYYGGEHALSYEYFNQALQVAMIIPDSMEIARLNSNMGWSLLELKRFPEAKKAFETGLEVALKLKVLETKEVAYSGMSDYYIAMKDYEKALHYFSLSRDVRDQMINEKRTAQFAEMQTRFETEQKENEIAQLGREKAEAELAISRQRNWIIVLVMSVIVLVLLGFFIIDRRRKRERISAAEREALFSKQLLDSTVNAQEEERQRVAKELHDGLVQSLVAVKMGLEHLVHSETLSAESKKAVQEKAAMVNEAAIEARNLSHQMMPRALMEAGLVSALDDMLNKSLGNANVVFTFEAFGMDMERFARNIEVGIYRIAQELVNNIIKHSGATEVNVQLMKTGTHLILHVEDNGKGFTPSDENRGIGLSNIYSRASSVNANVNIEPGAPVGTVANVRVPLV